MKQENERHRVLIQFSLSVIRSGHNTHLLLFYLDNKFMQPLVQWQLLSSMYSPFFKVSLVILKVNFLPKIPVASLSPLKRRGSILNGIHFHPNQNVYLSLVHLHVAAFLLLASYVREKERGNAFSWTNELQIKNSLSSSGIWLICFVAGITF